MGCIANFQGKSEAEQKLNNPNIPKTELQNNYIPLEVQKTAACVVNSYLMGTYYRLLVVGGRLNVVLSWLYDEEKAFVAKNVRQQYQPKGALECSIIYSKEEKQQSLAATPVVNIETVIQHLKRCQLTYVRGTKDQDLYTPLEGYYEASSQSERFQLLEQIILPFLQNKNSITILVAGEAGSGKTKFLEHVADYLLQSLTDTKQSLIPVYIKLVDPNVKDVSNHLLEDTLFGYGLNSHEVDLLLNSKDLEFCFLFDGVEELIRKNKAYSNFFHTNRIFERFPNSHSVFTARISGLPPKFELLFEPLEKDGNHPAISLQAKPINVAPFDPKAKKLYIEKFLLKRDVNGRANDTTESRGNATTLNGKKGTSNYLHFY